MFPTLRVSFTGIRSDQRYAVLLDIVPVDNKRYRYAYHRSSWLVAGKADPPAPCRIYAHPDSPFSGEQLRKQVVSFEKVKLTNNEMDKNGQVIILVQFFFLSLSTYDGLKLFVILQRRFYVIVVCEEKNLKEWEGHLQICNMIYWYICQQIK